ncbi:hypothetical protein AB0B54_32550 [Microbispora bryophytorum]|uniref:hypothetical protein n=1 Tax=Microbispora bryophytorum TaxID=1460882 RepID=UPI0033C2744F
MPEDAASNLQAAITSAAQMRWFAGKDLDVLIFRVNRRPDGSLFEQPNNFFAHLLEVLSYPVQAETGRRHKRVWHIGNKDYSPEEDVLSGVFGWARSGEAVEQLWDEATQTWVERVVLDDVTAVAPFTLIGDGRYLGILRHSSFTEGNVADALKQILNKGESRRNPPTTSWDVEPVGDLQDFLQWMREVDSVVRVDFVFKRPNPDAESDFEELFHRLDRLEAEQIRESVSSRDADRGLSKEALRTDPVTRGFISAAMAAFGYVVAAGLSQGKRTKYDQRRRVARERLENVDESWDGATESVKQATRQARRRRTNGRSET